MELSEEDNGTIIAGRTGRPQLTVGAKDGLSNPQLNLANTARGGRGGGLQLQPVAQWLFRARRV